MRETLENALRLLLSTDLRYASAVVALYVLSLFIVGARWKMMIEALNAKASLWQTTLTNLGGIFVNNTVPATRLGGEAFRIAAIRSRGNIDLSVAAASSLYDRLSEVLPVLALFILATPSLADIAGRIGGLPAAAALVLAAAGVACIVYRRLPRLRAKIGETLCSIRALRIPLKTFAGGVAYSSLMWLQDVVRLVAAAAAFGVHLDISQASMLAVIAILGGYTPTAGGLIAVEGGMVAGLVMCGITPDKAIAITALERSVSYGLGTVAGGLAVAALGGKKLWKLARSRS